MSELIDIIKSYKSEVFLNEDGDNLVIELKEGVTIEDIIKFETDNGINIPNILKELLLFSNGINFFGLNILSLEEIEFFPRSKMISFHNWGNGDFDCFSLGDNYIIGTIVFMSHNEDKLFPVSNSILDWFTGIIDEIKKEGALFHPMDYSYRKSEGMYKNISNKV